VPEQYVHRIGRTARAGADGIAIAFCSPDERGNLRDIERTTRQKIDVTPLPQGFAAAAEALKRLKPAPVQRPERSATKAHRRADGQRRDQRNNGQQRHPQRTDGHPAHRSGTQDCNGQRREGQTSYRPEAYREAGTDRRPEGGQRQPQQGEGRGGYRPPNSSNGAGQPNRNFNGRPRRPGGGPRRANG
jgi:ATP-dependent RNA helicase RhlE